jgi:hypothetical protein
MTCKDTVCDFFGGVPVGAEQVVGQGEESEGTGRAAVQGGAGRVSYSAALSDCKMHPKP